MAIQPLHKILANKQFRYGLVNRPPGLGAVPKGEYTYDKDCEGIDRVRHGIVTYTRELTDQEVKSFELLPLSGDDGKPLEVPRFPQAVIRKVQEALETLNYIQEDGLSEEDPTVEDEVNGCKKTFEIFRKYAQSKHLDADKALKELGYKGKL
jgi:hypothetical protein